jgi:3-oxoacyl-[acyl-carrier-protein] synthase III
MSQHGGLKVSPARAAEPFMRICSIAYALPEKLVTNEDLVARLAATVCDAATAAESKAFCDFLGQKLAITGAGTRYHRADGENALDLGISAGRRALESARLEPDAIDLLIYVGVGRGWLEPATANAFQSALGLSGATCFDVLDACASWLRAFDIAHHLLASRTYRYVMILNCEANFREYEPRRIKSLKQMERLWAGYTVGEAATATILSADEAGGADYRALFGNAGNHVRDCEIPLPHVAEFGPSAESIDGLPMHFLSNPDALARGAIRQLNRQYWSDPVFPSLATQVIFGHSVSVPVSQLVVRALELDAARHYEIFPRYGNVVSASLPLAMSLAVEEGRFQRGDRALLVMGGAGLTTALATFVY